MPVSQREETHIPRRTLQIWLLLHPAEEGSKGSNKTIHKHTHIFPHQKAETLNLPWLDVIIAQRTIRFRNRAGVVSSGQRRWLTRKAKVNRPSHAPRCRWLIQFSPARHTLRRTAQEEERDMPPDSGFLNGHGCKVGIPRGDWQIKFVLESANFLSGLSVCVCVCFSHSRFG